VKSHLSELFARFGAADRTALVVAEGGPGA
jgi:DNA-binding NarL/FixJ family response regulator